MSDPPAFDDAQIKYLDENYGGASSQNVHWMIFNGVLVFLNKRRMNAVDATGALVPKRSGAPTRLDFDRGDRSAVVAPDMARDPTAPTSKFWGVSWKTNKGRWLARYTDANGKSRTIGYFDTQEEAAHAANAAIRRAGLEGKRHTNPVVDGQLVPRARKTPKKRRREEPAATS